MIILESMRNHLCFCTINNVRGVYCCLLVFVDVNRLYVNDISVVFDKYYSSKNVQISHIKNLICVKAFLYTYTGCNENDNKNENKNGVSSWQSAVTKDFSNGNT